MTIDDMTQKRSPIKITGKDERIITDGGRWNDGNEERNERWGHNHGTRSAVRFSNNGCSVLPALPGMKGAARRAGGRSLKTSCGIHIYLPPYQFIPEISRPFRVIFFRSMSQTAKQNPFQISAFSYKTISITYTYKLYNTNISVHLGFGLSLSLSICSIWICLSYRNSTIATDFEICIVNSHFYPNIWTKLRVKLNQTTCRFMRSLVELLHL